MNRSWHIRNVLLLLSVVSLGKSIAQAPSKHISGTVSDSSTQKGVPYVSVALLKNDSFYVGTTADAHGKFEFSKILPGKYMLQVTALGYVKTTLPVNLIANVPLVLNGIRLQRENGTLEEVTVTQQKSLVEDKGDRLVYNAERDISNAGGTAADVLRKVPMLTVDLNGNVQMRGNGNVRVLINGKPSAMMARNLADALRQMPANVIKSVEVITSPGARYDAEGAAGVINIVTKKGLQGLSGSANVTAGNFNRGLGTSFTYRKKKISLSLSANAYQYRNKFQSRSLRESLKDNAPSNYLSQQSAGDNVGTGGYGELSVDYDPDSLNRINFSANIWGGNFPSNSTINTQSANASGELIEAFRNESRFKNPYGNGQLDLGYTRTFKKPSQEFSFLTQFSRMPDNYFYDTYFYSASDIVFSRNSSRNYSRNKEYTLQADYTHPISIIGRKDTTQVKFEVGSKAIYRDIGSEFRLSTANDANSPLISDPLQSNDFDYIQKVFSGYTSIRVDTKKKWSLNAGVRLERTELNGDFTSTQTRISNSFNNLIPSVTVSRSVKKNTFKTSYTQRIQRPMIWFLNPWRNASDPKNIWTGNPYLVPELSHAFEAGHTLTGENGFSLNTAFFYRFTNNSFEFLKAVDSSGVGVTKPQNIGRRRDYGMNLNIATQPNKSWNLSGGGEIRYLNLRTATTTLRNSGIVWNVNFNTTYKLPKNYTIQANGHFASGWIGLQSDFSGWYWYGVSGKKEIWDKKASLTLAVNNPFQAEITQTGKTFDAGFREESEFRRVNRSVRLTFEWRFGQMTTGGKQSKKITNDDRGR